MPKNKHWNNKNHKKRKSKKKTWKLLWTSCNLGHWQCKQTGETTWRPTITKPYQSNISPRRAAQRKLLSTIINH